MARVEVTGGPASQGGFLKENIGHEKYKANPERGRTVKKVAKIGIQPGKFMKRKKNETEKGLRRKKEKKITTVKKKKKAHSKKNQTNEKNGQKKKASRGKKKGVKKKSRKTRKLKRNNLYRLASTIQQKGDLQAS